MSVQRQEGPANQKGVRSVVARAGRAAAALPGVVGIAIRSRSVPLLFCAAW